MSVVAGFVGLGAKLVWVVCFALFGNNKTIPVTWITQITSVLSYGLG